MNLDPKLTRYYARVSGAVSFKIGLIFLGFLGGNYLDAKLHTAPWLMMLGLVTGAGIGIWYLLRVVESANKEESN